MADIEALATRHVGLEDVAAEEYARLARFYPRRGLLRLWERLRVWCSAGCRGSLPGCTRPGGAGGCPARCAQHAGMPAMTHLATCQALGAALRRWLGLACILRAGAHARCAALQEPQRAGQGGHRAGHGPAGRPRVRGSHSLLRHDSLHHPHGCGQLRVLGLSSAGCCVRISPFTAKPHLGPARAVHTP